MDIGMLWFDDDAQRTLAQKVLRALDYYRAKYGREPNVCYVHPAMLAPDGAPAQLGAVRVKGSKTVIKHHFWMGIEANERNPHEHSAVSESD